MAHLLSSVTQKLLSKSDGGHRRLPQTNDKHRHKEKVHKTQLKFTEKKRSNSFSYPFDMMTTITKQPKHSSCYVLNASRAPTILQRHEADEADDGKHMHFVSWSRGNEWSEEEKRVIADVHYDMTQALTKAITRQKENQSVESKLLSQTIHIKGPDRMEEKDLHNDDYYWDNINNGIFKIRLDFDFDEWMKDKESHETEFINEIVDALGVEADTAAFEVYGYERGSTIFKMCVGKIWSFYRTHVQRVDHQIVVSNYIRSMRVQDQISVKRNNKWCTATVTTLFDNECGNGKHFQVRFNPNKDGEDPFWWNTDWFYTKRDAKRLRFPGQEYHIKDIQGHRLTVQWEAPSLAERDSEDEVVKEDHIFVRFSKNHWFRCVVVGKWLQYNNTYWIKVKKLKDGNTRKLNLSSFIDRNSISFVDMRD